MTQALDIAQEIGRYRIHSEIGRGAMGRVYLAEDPNIGRRVALKVFAPEGIDPEAVGELRQRFLTEAKAAGRLNHPGVVTVYDADTDSATDHAFIVMELVEGESLESVLARRGQLGVVTAVGYAMQIARALHYAHEEGVVHRDVKPANILVTSEGQVKVMDFGVAKLSSMTQTIAGEVLGTPVYMSPEQIQGQPTDRRSDLFSLGTVLYLCLTGHNPFRADAIATIAFKIIHDDVESPRSFNPEIPEDLAAVVERALAKPVEGRFQTGAAFARALDATTGTVEIAAKDLETTQELQALDDLDDMEDMPDLDSTVLSGPFPPPASERRKLLWALPAALVLAAAAAAFWVLRPSEPPAAEMEGAAGMPEIEAPPPEETAEAASPEPQAAETTPAETAPAETSPAETPPPPAVPSPAPAAPVADASLEILYNNKLRQGEISVSIDGTRVWKRELSSSVLGRVSGGQRMVIPLPVASGRRSVEVRIKRPGEDDAVETIDGELKAGETRQLEVDFKRRDNEVELKWVE